MCTSAVWPSSRMVSTMPSAVSGLTNEDAPSAAAVPAGSSRQNATSTARYCPYIAPPAAATVLPTSACAASDEPAATTVPAPSLPTGIDTPTLASIARIAAGGSGAMITGRSGVPVATAAVTSAPASSRPRSDGLIGAASTRISTSVGPGTGTSTVSRNNSTFWSSVTSERSCSADAGVVIKDPSSWNPVSLR